MSITNGYCLLTDLKAALSITDANDDTSLSVIIESASRSIDNETGRRFWKSGSDETRLYTAKDAMKLQIDDLVSVTSIATDYGSRGYGYAWTSSMYDLWPFNAAYMADPEPYREIRVVPFQTTYTFPVGVAKGVKIIGLFGWPGVPRLVNQACIQQSLRWFTRLSTPLGSSSMSALGKQTMSIPELDPDVREMLSTFMRHR